MRYLITGGAGFIGSHLAEHLVQNNNDVLILDDFSTGCHQNVSHLEENPRFQIIAGTVLDSALVQECIQQVDQVFHLASAVGVQLIIDEPVRTIETIVRGTAVVLDACARYRTPVLLTSTSEVYGKSTKVPFSEEDDSVIGAPTCRRWSYASAKALDEFAALAHWYKSRLPVVVVRLFNTVGPRQTGRYGMVIPRFVKQALSGEPLTVFGDGTQSRCFCHVNDVVGAIAKLLDTPECRGQLFNVGNNEEISIFELAELVITLAHSSSDIRRIPYREAYGAGFEDMQRRVPNLSKIRDAIGYRADHSLRDILRDVIAHTQMELDRTASFATPT